MARFGNTHKGINSGKQPTQTRVPFKLDNASLEWLADSANQITNRNQFINQAVAEKIASLKALQTSSSPIHSQQ